MPFDDLPEPRETEPTRPCFVCGAPVILPGAMCSHHTYVAPADTWSSSNRAFCDFIHRGIIQEIADPKEVSHIMADYSTPLRTVDNDGVPTGPEPERSVIIYNHDPADAF